MLSYQLLDAFRGLFEGQIYRHRRSNLGDAVAMHLYEDLYQLGRSKNYTNRVDAGISVLNTKNVRRGIKARRGDGSFGGVVPGTAIVRDRGYTVNRGSIATIEIGIEVKIMMKAMIKQVDRVKSDLKTQVEQFKSKGGEPICIGIVGINEAAYCTTYEGDREYRTDGKKHKHPADEADEAEERLREFSDPIFDEFLVFRFKATNEPPYQFAWSDENAISLDYGAALVRISQEYQSRG